MIVALAELVTVLLEIFEIISPFKILISSFIDTDPYPSILEILLLQRKNNEKS